MAQAYPYWKGPLPGTEPQLLDISGQILSITGGNSVVIPSIAPTQVVQLDTLQASDYVEVGPFGNPLIVLDGYTGTITATNTISGPQINTNTVNTTDIVATGTTQTTNLVALDVSTNNLNVSTINGAPISSIPSTWSFYPAVSGTVDLSSSAVTNATSITGTNITVSASSQLDLSGGDDMNLSTKGTMALTANAKTLGAYGDITLDAYGSVVPVLDLGFGGQVSITAHTPISTNPTLTSAVKISGASVTSYAGALQPLGSLAGTNYIHGDGAVSITAGIPAILPTAPFQVKIEGDGTAGNAGVVLESSNGVEVPQGTILYADEIRPYYDPFTIGQPPNLRIGGLTRSPPGVTQYVDMDKVNSIAFDASGAITDLKTITTAYPLSIQGASSISEIATTTMSLQSGTTMDLSAGTAMSISSGTTMALTANNGPMTLTTTGANDIDVFPGTSGGFHIFSQNGNPSANPEFKIENQNGNPKGAYQKFYKNSASPANGDEGGVISFHMNNSSGTDTEFCEITTYAQNVATGAEQGYLNVDVASPGLGLVTSAQFLDGGIKPTAIYDTTGTRGSAGQILSSTGSGLAWILGASPNFRPTLDFYVAKNGNDVTGDGSSESPYQTIQRAITATNGVRGVAGANCIIHIYAGKYTENLTISGLGYLCFMGEMNGQNLNEIVEITGNHSISLTTLDDLQNQQIIFQGLQMTSLNSVGSLINDTSTRQHTLAVVDVYMYAYDQAINQATTVATRNRFNNSYIRHATASLSQNALISLGVVGNASSTALTYFQLCELAANSSNTPASVTTGNVLSVVGGASIGAAQQVVFSNAAAAPGPLIYLGNSTGASNTHSFGFCSFVYLNTTGKTNAQGQYAIAGNTNLTNVIIAQSQFALTGLPALATSYAINLTGALSIVFSGANVSLPGTAALVNSTLTPAFFTTVDGATVRLGANAGLTNQGTGSIAIGSSAGQANLGASSVAIGNFASQSGGSFANTIVLNAGATAVNPGAASSCYINPIRFGAYSSSDRDILFYNPTTSEVVRKPTGMAMFTGSTSQGPATVGLNFSATSFTGGIIATISAGTPTLNITNAGVYSVSVAVNVLGGASTASAFLWLNQAGANVALTNSETTVPAGQRMLITKTYIIQTASSATALQIQFNGSGQVTTTFNAAPAAGPSYPAMTVSIQRLA